MNRGSTDNISLVVLGLNDPKSSRQPKKGNEHIKIVSSIKTNPKHKLMNDKENSYP